MEVLSCFILLSLWNLGWIQSLMHDRQASALCSPQEKSRPLHARASCFTVSPYSLSVSPALRPAGTACPLLLRLSLTSSLKTEMTANGRGKEPSANHPGNLWWILMSYGRGSLHCLCEWGAQGWHNEKFPHQAGLLASTKKKKKKKDSMWPRPERRVGRLWSTKLFKLLWRKKEERVRLGLWVCMVA